MLTNEEIISGCIQQNRKAQQELYQRFGAKMYGFCLRYSPSSAEAQDLLQEGFIKVFDSIKNLRETSLLEGWMSRIFINLALSKYRKKKSGPQFVELELADSQEEDQDVVTDMNELSIDEVLDLMKQLPEKYGMILNLYAVDGLSHKEIASLLQTTETNSKSMLSRARKMLKELIETKK